jgi:hypothetical protein
MGIRMTRQHDDAELLERYRQASSQERVAPSAAIRAAILAEGRRIAALRQTTASADSQPRRPARRVRRRLAAAASVAVATVAALLVLPHLWEPERSSVTPTASLPEPGAAPAVSAAPAAGAAPKASSVPPASGASSADRVRAPVANFVPSLASDAAAARTVTSEAAGDGSLRSAVVAGDRDRIARLVAAGADLRGTDSLGRTPLMLAVMQRRVDVVRLLLAHGAEPSVPDLTGETPLQWARRHDAADIVTVLEAAGAR